MGNSNSSQIAQAMATNISESVTSSLQTINTNTTAWNSFIGKCSDEVSIAMNNNCTEGANKVITYCSDKKGCSDTEIK